MMICNKAKECVAQDRCYCGVPHISKLAYCITDSCEGKELNHFTDVSCIPVEQEALSRTDVFVRDYESQIHEQKGHVLNSMPIYKPVPASTDKPKIVCEYIKNGLCQNSEVLLASVSECEHCPSDKPKNTCALLCDCEEETCNIGEVVEEDSRAQKT